MFLFFGLRKIFVTAEMCKRWEERVGFCAVHDEITFLFMAENNIGPVFMR